MSEEGGSGTDRVQFCAHCGSESVSTANVRAKTYDCPECGIISERSVRYAESDPDD